jgi:hypothetical protein
LGSALRRSSRLIVDAARPSRRAIARKLSPSAFDAASRSRSSKVRCVPPDIAPSRILIARDMHPPMS